MSNIAILKSLVILFNSLSICLPKTAIDNNPKYVESSLGYCYRIVNTDDDINDDDEIIIASSKPYNGGYYALGDELNNGKFNSIITDIESSHITSPLDDSLKLKVKKEDDYYLFINNDNHVLSIDINGLIFSNDRSSYLSKWNLIIHNDFVYINSLSTSSYSIKFNSLTSFFSLDGNILPRMYKKDYRFIASNGFYDFCKEANEMLSSSCSSFNLSESDWDNISNLYMWIMDITTSDEDVIKYGMGNENGNEVEHFLATYDFVINKYGYDSFLTTDGLKRELNKIVDTISDSTNSKTNDYILIIVLLMMLLFPVVVVIKSKTKEL